MNISKLDHNLSKTTDDLKTKHTEVERTRLKRNFSLITLYQLVLRTGWIFKTESIVMPAVLDVMGGSAWLRGCLPMLNRFGQSIPPLLASDRIRKFTYKKYVLATCCGVMGLCFLGLSFAWFLAGGGGNAYLPFVFLVIYGVFFSSVGLHNLTMSLMYGKLIPVTRRGRLMLVSTTIGCVSAITCAWFLLRPWLSQESGRFELIFLFTGCAFCIASVISLMFQESPDQSTAKPKSFSEIVRGCIGILATDGNFRRLAIVSGMFGMSMTLFPHYQALARERFDLGLASLVPWVIAQNIGAAGFSIPFGWVADRFGNRLVLRIQMFLLCLAPITAIWVSRSELSSPYVAQVTFMIVFFLLGLTPIMMRTFSNYTLEIAGRRHQPKYLSTLSLCMAGPAILTSTLMGLLVDQVGFEFTFCLVIICIVIGGVLAFGLAEPRDSSA